VFREMQLRREGCRLSEPLETAVDYTLVVEVEDGSVRSARLGGAEVIVAGVKLPLSREEWPPELERRVACLEPHLGRMEMAPAPADGRYETRFSLAAAPAGPARAPARSQGAPDPTEPGLPDQVRLARYVFGEMLRGQVACPLQAPSEERVRYVLEVEVRSGAVVRSRLLRTDPEGAAGLMTEDWFAALSSYSTCLEPRLQGMRMEPAPADGVYPLAYATPGRAAPARP
jgi:hypothetical protein